MKRGASPAAGKRLDWALLLGDFAIGAWLWFSFWGFRGGPAPTCLLVLGPAAATAVLALVLGTHRAAGNSRLATPARFAGLFLAVAAAAWAASRLGWVPASPWEALWLGAATAVMLLLLRGFYWRLSGPRAARGAELARWLAVGAAGTLVMIPFYFAGSLGSGDAHWYVVMLTDFLVQLRAGVFPVWVGQSPYAFNGAVSPLRYAPGFQYYGGIVDLLTGQSLQPVAVKNLCLCLSGVGGAFSAYACLRPLVSGRNWIACLLAILWISGPGVLAPVVSGDQYMTFVAMPFVPLVLHGCWRVLALDDVWGRVCIASGLAALWICHPPIGLWLTVISGAIYVGAILVRRRWVPELRRLSLMAVIFLGMGSLPFVSLLCLDNQIHVSSVGGSAALEVHRYFPANFHPINPAGGGLADYQIGYALLGVLGLSILLLALSRPKGAWALALAAVLIIPFTVPVPRVTDALWDRLPSWFVTIDNVWPMQRLFLVWSALAAFFGAIVLGSAVVSGRRWRHAAVLSLLALGLAWSAEEARKVTGIAARTRNPPEQTRIMEGPTNTQISRYAYTSFSTAPGYASHGFMDAWFENRLLDPSTMLPLVANADAAAPGDSANPGSSTLVSTGLMTAENITQSSSYFLRPTLTLDPGKRYALRIEFLEKGLEGTLQLMQDTLFREYILPDSGVGIGRSGPPRAFGTEPTSGRVLSLTVLGKDPVPLKAILITPRLDHKDFIAARYWLYTYERSKLPIDVVSWIPYIARFSAPGPAYLESPRMWLKDWRATVNGYPVAAERSPENLVMVPVKAGPSVLKLEYVPPAVVRASFWVLVCFWLTAGSAALGWVLGTSPAAEVSGRPALLRRLAPAAVAALALAAALALVGIRRERAGAAAYSRAVEQVRLAGPEAIPSAAPSMPSGRRAEELGPVHVVLTFPSQKSGRHEPILTTGRTGAGDFIYVIYADDHHVRVGFDHWGGDGALSGPIAIDYNDPHDIWVLEGSLYPPSEDDSFWGATSPSTRAGLKSTVTVILDGKTVLSARSPTHPTTRDETTIARNSIGGSTADPEFSGIVHLAERTGMGLPPGVTP